MPFKPGQSGNPKGKIPGTLNKATLTKLERRAMFEERISQKWEQIIDQLPPQYIADQYLGKAPDKLEVDATVHATVTSEVLAIAEEELRKRKLNAKPKELGAPNVLS